MIKSVKSLFLLSFFLLISMVTYSAVKTPSELTFDGEVYKQVFQEGDGVKTNRVTEYLKRGEDLNAYVKMVAIWEYPGVTDVKVFAENLIKTHKQNYPSLERSIIVKNDGSEAQVDFIIAEGDITEFNIFRLMKRDGHVVAYQYVYRDYSALKTVDNAKWWNNLKQNKNKWAELMTQVNYVK